MSKYEPLARYLDLQSRAEVIMSFADVEEILGTALPPSAFKYREWWANETSPVTSHAQCSAWMMVGYHAFANMGRETVRFVRKPGVVHAATARHHGAPSRRSPGMAERPAPQFYRRAVPMLIAFGGLPGVGKTTIARHLAETRGATYLSVDDIEQAVRASCGMADVGGAGYTVAYAQAEANLRLGRVVLVDCLNPTATTRKAWRATAAAACAPILEVEIACGDPAEHRRRIESRCADTPSQTDDGTSGTRHRHEHWTDPHLMIDSAQVTVAEAAEAIGAAMDRTSGIATWLKAVR